MAGRALLSKEENPVRPINTIRNGEEAVKEDEAADEEDEEEECIAGRKKKVDERPSKEDVEEHCLTHLPFRSWRKHCVRGKSKSGAHKKKERT